MKGTRPDPATRAHVRPPAADRAAHAAPPQTHPPAHASEENRVMHLPASAMGGRATSERHQIAPDHEAESLQPPPPSPRGSACPSPSSSSPKCGAGRPAGAPARRLPDRLPRPSRPDELRPIRCSPQRRPRQCCQCRLRPPPTPTRRRPTRAIHALPPPARASGAIRGPRGADPRCPPSAAAGHRHMGCPRSCGCAKQRRGAPWAGYIAHGRGLPWDWVHGLLAPGPRPSWGPRVRRRAT